MLCDLGQTLRDGRKTFPTEFVLSTLGQKILLSLHLIKCHAYCHITVSVYIDSRSVGVSCWVLQCDSNCE